MRQDHRGGIEHQGPFDHLARIDLRGIDGAAEHLLATDDTMAVVEEQAQENLVSEALQAVHEIAAGGLRRGQGIRAMKPRLEIAAAELQRR